MARDFAMKLRLAAVVLGCTTRKDLAAAFRGLNPDTTFDVERADKWLSGKALPRAADVYRDWSRLLALDRPHEWMAACSADELLEVLATQAGVAPKLLLEGARDFPNGARRHLAPRPIDSGAGFIEGAYACYSYSFSPYFPGWLIRSSMLIGPGHGPGSVAYSHNMPPLPTRFSGEITFNGRGMQIALHQTAAGDMRIYMALFGPAPPATVLAGMLCGAAVVTPEPEPSAARIILIRLPATEPSLRCALYGFSARGIDRGRSGLGRPSFLRSRRGRPPHQGVPAGTPTQWHRAGRHRGISRAGRILQPRALRPRRRAENRATGIFGQYCELKVAVKPKVGSTFRQRPRHTGLRFSAKARAPSSWSSLS